MKIPGTDCDVSVPVHKRVSIPWTFPTHAICVSLFLLCSCATERSGRRQLPQDVDLNREAGRGGLVFVNLRLKRGEELPFIVDTGSPGTLFDRTLLPKLGFRLPLGTWSVPFGNEKQKSGVYWEPKLYLGNTRLKTGRLCAVVDFQRLSRKLGHPVRGILAMDCLKHYCIQLDFQAGKMRFLDPKHLDTVQLGRPLPLRLFFYSQLFTFHKGLAGGKASRLLVDTGWNGDGLVKTNSSTEGASGGWVHLQDCVWNRETYTDLNLRTGGDVLGLNFLARHLVTFDFPRHTMYLKLVSPGPLKDQEFLDALEFLKNLKKTGQVPGWSKDDKGTISFETYRDPGIFGFAARKEAEPTVCHYTIMRKSKEDSWKLQKAWRTDKSGKTIEEFPLPWAR